MSRQSAGTFEPSSIITMSPGTNSFAGIFTCLLSLKAVAFKAVNLFNASIAFSDLNSWMKPNTPLKKTIISINKASLNYPTKTESNAAISKINIRKLLICSRNKM